MTFTKHFKNISKHDTSIAGGKGASLGEITQANISVPEGFVVLTNAFEEFLNNEAKQEIRNELNNAKNNKPHATERAAENIRKIILNTEVPEEIQTEIQKEFKDLNCKFVAVRSSATVEDSKSAAWAGQLDSFLNTIEEDLLEKIKECWASLFTPRAIFYRFEQGLKDEHVSMAVVIQKMVNSEKSGVAFSVHPVTEDHNHILIEAGLGLGEAIVSGQITPDAYIVSKKDNLIIDININKQLKALYRHKVKGSEWQELKSEGEKQTLSEQEITELAKIIIQIENHYGTPQDIEWAYEDGEFFITQSRPITTLDAEEDNRQEYRKIMNRSMFLMSCETWDQGERIELPKSCENNIAFDPLFVYEPGKGISIYYNFSDPTQESGRVTEYFNKNEGYFDGLMGSD